MTSSAANGAGSNRGGRRIRGKHGRKAAAATASVSAGMETELSCLVKLFKSVVSDESASFTCRFKPCHDVTPQSAGCYGAPPPAWGNKGGKHSNARCAGSCPGPLTACCSC
jgi:hypothetical protein